MIDMIHLNEATRLYSFTDTLKELNEDLSSLVSWTSTWDWEHGVFRHEDDEED